MIIIISLAGMKLSIKLSRGMKDTKNATIYDCSTLKYVSDRFRDWLMLKRFKAIGNTFPRALRKVNVHQHTLHKISHKKEQYFESKHTHAHLTHLHQLAAYECIWLTSFSKEKNMLITLKCIFDKQFIIS